MKTRSGLMPRAIIPATDLFSVIEAAAGRRRAGVEIVDSAYRRAYKDYEEILGEAEEKAAALTARDIGPGDSVAMFARTSFEFIVACLACWRIGAVMVPLAAPPRFFSQDVWKDQAAARLRASGAKALLIQDDDGVAAALSGVVQVPVGDLRSSTSVGPYRPARDDPAIIQFTSGSTANPRGVVISHRSLVAQLDLLLEAVDVGASERHLVSWLPLYHDLGLVATLLSTMAAGDPVTLMPPELFILDPGTWIMEISRRRADRSAAPSFAYGMAARAMEKGLPEAIDLSCWTCAASGGESVNPRPVNRFLDAASPFGFDPGAFCAGYGLAEATCVSTVVRPGDGLTIDAVDRAELLRGRATTRSAEGRGVAIFVSCGQPLPGVSVQIASGDGLPLGDRQIGEIWVAGPTLMQGYVGDDDATDGALAGGWLRTGDLGYLSDGQLYVTGRAKDTVIVRGQNFSPEDLERVVEAVEGARPGATAVIGVQGDESEAAVLAIETRWTDRARLLQLRRDIQKHFFRETGIGAFEVMLLPPSTLPRTSSGKLQRTALRTLYTSGDLRDVELLSTSTGGP